MECLAVRFPRVIFSIYLTEKLPRWPHPSWVPNKIRIRIEEHNNFFVTIEDALNVTYCASNNEQGEPTALTRVSRSSAILGLHLSPKSVELGHIYCMNYVGLELVMTIVSIGSKSCLGKGFLRIMVKISNFGTSSWELRFGPFGLSAIPKCSTMNNGMRLK